MPSLTLVKPWDVQLVANTLYRLYAEQMGLPQATVIATPKDRLRPPADKEAATG